MSEVFCKKLAFLGIKGSPVTNLVIVSDKATGFPSEEILKDACPSLFFLVNESGTDISILFLLKDSHHMVDQVEHSNNQKSGLLVRPLEKE